MKNSWCTFGVIVLAVMSMAGVGCNKFKNQQRQSASASPAGAGANSLSAADLVRNPWWPLVPSNSWTYKKAKADGTPDPAGHIMTMSILPIQATFGCGPEPVHVYFHKDDADAYWGPGGTMNLHWFLGVQPDGTIMGYGHYTADLKDNVLVNNGTMNYRSADPNVPAYIIMPGNVTNGQRISNRHSLPTAFGITTACIPDDKNYYSTWNVVWTQTTVNIPNKDGGYVYSGPAMMASFDEQSGGSRAIEDWYFVQGIGPVRIHTKDIQGNTVVDMLLDSFHLKDISVIPSNPADPIPPVSAPIIPLAQLSVGLQPNPTASLPKIIDVSVGQTVYFAWSSVQAAFVSSFYTSDSPDNCPGGFGNGVSRLPWTSNTSMGTSSLTFSNNCYAGHSYNYTIQAVSSTGDAVPATVIVRVAPLQAEPAPTVSLSMFAPPNSAKFASLTANQTVDFYWNIQNAGSVSSYYYATAPDTCPGGFTANSTTVQWVVSQPASGSKLGVPTMSCQNARSYTYVVIVKSPSGKQSAMDQVTIQVNGSVKQQIDAASSSQPQDWDVFVYYYNAFTTGAKMMNLSPSSFVPLVDQNKNYSKLPLDVWWRCTQMNDCHDMIAFYAPTTPPYSIEGQMEIAVGSNKTQSWDVWNYYFAQFAGVTIQSPEAYGVQVDLTKRFVATMSVVDWWNCTQMQNCNVAAALYAPAVPNPVQGPMVTLTAGTATISPAPIITVNVGDNVTYSWSSGNVTSLSSSYVILSGDADNCPGGYNTPNGPAKPWVAMIPNTADSVSATAIMCQSGHTYYMTINGIGPAGQAITASIMVHVN